MTTLPDLDKKGTERLNKRHSCGNQRQQGRSSWQYNTYPGKSLHHSILSTSLNGNAGMKCVKVDALMYTFRHFSHTNKQKGSKI